MLQRSCRVRCRLAHADLHGAGALRLIPCVAAAALYTKTIWAHTVDAGAAAGVHSIRILEGAAHARGAVGRPNCQLSLQAVSVARGVVRV